MLDKFPFWFNIVTHSSLDGWLGMFVKASSG